jgi:hypothetical protein
MGSKTSSTWVWMASKQEQGLPASQAEVITASCFYCLLMQQLPACVIDVLSTVCFSAHATSAPRGHMRML